MRSKGRPGPKKTRPAPYHRRIDCRGYDTCLDAAARANQVNFTRDCTKCSQYRPAPLVFTSLEVQGCMALLGFAFGKRKRYQRRNHT